MESVVVPKKKRGRVGRPAILRPEELKQIPTRCPESLLRYMKSIYPYAYRDLTEMYNDMLQRFVLQRPWENGLDWRKPRGRIERSNGEVAATGWTQVNVQVPASMKERIAAIAVTNGVTNAVFVYTAMFWWAMYIMSPQSVKASAVKAVSAK